MSGSLGAPDNPEQTILHVDMDAFYASVELLRHPELRGQPVVVGGTAQRGVVAAASYEARSYGIHSAMPTVRARRLCPHAVVLAGDHGLYREVSRRIMEIFASVTPHVEALSLDEAFLDVTGSRRLLGDGVTIGHALRKQVHDQEGLWCSVGVARPKFMAKLASERAKPTASRRGPIPGSGVFEVPPGDELRFLHPLPIRALWGVGPATFARLDRIGVATVGDLAALTEQSVQSAVGKAVGKHLHALSRGVDPRKVESDVGPKSISHEETFAHDKHDVAQLEADLVRMADGVAGRLRKADIGARTVTLKIRFGDFQTITRSATLSQPSDSGVEIAREARSLLDKVLVRQGVRLLGVSATGLQPITGRQLSFDDVDTGPAWSEADAAVDEIRRKFGAGAIGPARLADERGLRIKTEDDTQWGPDAPASPSATPTADTENG